MGIAVCDCICVSAGMEEEGVVVIIAGAKVAVEKVDILFELIEVEELNEEEEEELILKYIEVLNMVSDEIIAR